MGRDGKAGRKHSRINLKKYSETSSHSWKGLKRIVLKVTTEFSVLFAF